MNRRESRRFSELQSARSGTCFLTVYVSWSRVGNRRLCLTSWTLETEVRDCPDEGTGAGAARPAEVRHVYTAITTARVRPRDERRGLPQRRHPAFGASLLPVAENLKLVGLAPHHKT